MVDDLTTRGVTEPYRMFTSRAEYRLSLRIDNADQRLTPKAIELDCVSKTRRTAFMKKMDELDRGRALLEETSAASRDLSAEGVNVRPDGTRRCLLDVLGYEGVNYGVVSRLLGESPVDVEVFAQLQRDSLYKVYQERQSREAAALRRDEGVSIPDGFRFAGVPGLSAELSVKLEVARPNTLAQASKIEGMTPAALVLLAARLRKSA
jgi:tRNA uridine 5-carboxymethylaminomethyl modification enzyme